MTLISKPDVGAPAVTAASKASGKRKEAKELTSLLNQHPLIPKTLITVPLTSHCLNLVTWLHTRESGKSILSIELIATWNKISILFLRIKGNDEYWVGYRKLCPSGLT